MAEAAPAAIVAPVSGIRPPMALCIEANLAENWRSFKQKWQNYAIITNLDKQTAKCQVALLLHVIGDQALKVYKRISVRHRRRRTYRRRDNTEIRRICCRRNDICLIIATKTKVRHFRIVLLISECRSRLVSFAIHA